MSALPTNLNSPGVLVVSGADGGQEFRGFVQYRLYWPTQTMRPLSSWLLESLRVVN